LSCDPDLRAFTPEAVEQAELSIKYEGYIRRQEEEARKLRKYDGMEFPAGFSFQALPGLSAEVQGKLAGIAGAQAVVFPPPSLPGSGHGMPVQFVIGTTDSCEKLDEVSRTMKDKANASGMFMFVDTDLKIDKPQVMVEFDRDKAAQLGLTMSDLGRSLASMLGGGYVNYFSMSGR